MRVPVRVIDKEGKLTDGVRRIDRIDDARATSLAALGRLATIEVFDDGRTVIYGPIEYGCSLCGEYGHAKADCPDSDDEDGLP